MEEGGLPQVFKVLIANMSPLMAEVLENTFELQVDVQLQGIAADYLRAVQMVNENTDVILLGVQRAYPLPSIASYLLDSFPGLRIITIDERGESAAIYWLTLYAKSINPFSTSELLQCIRHPNITDSV